MHKGLDKFSFQSDVKECEARIQEMEEDHMRSEDWFREYVRTNHAII